MTEAIYETLQSLTALERYSEWHPVLDRVAKSHITDFTDDEGSLFLRSFVDECIKNTVFYKYQIEKHQDDYEEAKNEANELKEENNHLVRMTQDLLHQMNDLKEFLEQADKVSTELRDHNNELANENYSLRAQLEENQIEIRPLTEELISPRKPWEGLDNLSTEHMRLIELQNQLQEKNGYIEAFKQDLMALEEEKARFEAIVNAQRDYEFLKEQCVLEEIIMELSEQYKKTSEGNNELMMAKKVQYIDDDENADGGKLLATDLNLESINDSNVEDEVENKNLTLSKSLSCSPSKFSSSHTKKQSLLFEAQMMSPDNRQSLTERRKSTGRKNKSVQPFNLKVNGILGFHHSINKSDQNGQESSTGQTESDHQERELKSSWMIQSHEDGQETNRVVEKLDEVIGDEGHGDGDNCSLFGVENWGMEDFRGVEPDLLTSPTLDNRAKDEEKQMKDLLYIDIGKAQMDYNFRPERSSSQPCVGENEGKEDYENKLFSYRENKENKNVNLSSMDFCGDKDLSAQRIIYEDNLESMTDVKSDEIVGIQRSRKNTEVPEQAQKDSALLFKKKSFGENMTQTEDDLKVLRLKIPSEEASTQTHSSQKEDVDAKVYQENGFQTDESTIARKLVFGITQTNEDDNGVIMKKVSLLNNEAQTLLKQVEEVSMQTDLVKVSEIEVQTLTFEKEVGEFAIQTESVKVSNNEVQTLNKEVEEIAMQTERLEVLNNETQTITETKEVGEFAIQTEEEEEKVVIELVQNETQTPKADIKECFMQTEEIEIVKVPEPVYEEFCTQTNEDDNGVVINKVQSVTNETQTLAKELEETSMQTEALKVSTCETQTIVKEVIENSIQTESIKKAEKEFGIQTEEAVVKKVSIGEGFTQTNEKENGTVILKGETKGSSTQTCQIKSKEKSMQTEQEAIKSKRNSISQKQVPILHRSTQTDRTKRRGLKSEEGRVVHWRKNPKYAVLIGLAAPIITVIVLLLFFFLVKGKGFSFNNNNINCEEL